MSGPVPPYRGNKPLYTYVTTVILIAAATVLIILRPNNVSTLSIVGLIVATVPSLFAFGFAEKNSRDIHNGVVTQKVKEGTVAALEATGVTEVAKHAGESTELAMRALAQILEKNTAVTQTNTDATQQNTAQHMGGKANG